MVSVANDEQYKNDPNSTSIHECNAASLDRDAANNANTINNAADVAIASKNPIAMAAGGAVKAADKLTGGRALQSASNKLSESGLGDKAGQVASLVGSKGSKGAEAADSAAKGAEAADKAKKSQEAAQAAQKAQQAQQQGNKKGAELANQDALKKHDQANNPNKKGAAASNGDAASSSGTENNDSKGKSKKRLPNGRLDTSSGEEEEEEFSNEEGSKALGKFVGWTIIITNNSKLFTSYINSFCSNNCCRCHYDMY